MNASAQASDGARLAHLLPQLLHGLVSIDRVKLPTPFASEVGHGTEGFLLRDQRSKEAEGGPTVSQKVLELRVGRRSCPWRWKGRLRLCRRCSRDLGQDEWAGRSRRGLSGSPCSTLIDKRGHRRFRRQFRPDLRAERVQLFVAPRLVPRKAVRPVRVRLRARRPLGSLLLARPLLLALS
eukprot:6214093-Pleurochrysis_carterae.AAC.6